MEQNKWSASSIVCSIILIALVIGGGVYFLQKFKNVQSVKQNHVSQPVVAGKEKIFNEPSPEELGDPLLYVMKKSVPATVAKKILFFDSTAEQLKNMAKECESQHPENYFNNLVAKFSGEKKIVYTFKYAGKSQTPDAFVVTVIPNKMGYRSLEEFKKDFDICAAGGDAYPTKLNSAWLLFVSSCGSGLDDGSGLPHGCEKVRGMVEPSLKLR
jgi:hypothetical protein